MRIETNGISVHYSIEGPENGPVVVLSHSLAANLAMWDWQMPVLGDYRVVRYDTRVMVGRTHLLVNTRWRRSRMICLACLTP